MKNLLLLSITLTLTVGNVFSQKVEKKIDALNFLLIDEKFEDAVYKGENLMQNDTYKKHPLIYLYTSKAYYGMSRQPGKFDVGEKTSKYPKPLKMAQKYLYKFVKTNKKAKKYFPDYNGSLEEEKEYLEAIADTSNNLAQTLFVMEKPRKAASVYKYAFKAVPTDPVLQLWQGICEVKSKNAVEGDKNIKAALKLIDENFEPSKATSSVLAKGMLIVEEHLRGKSDYQNADKAKKLIEVFKKYDPDELDKKKMEERNEKMKKEAEANSVMRKFYSDENDEDNKKMLNKENETETELDRLEKEAQGGK